MTLVVLIAAGCASSSSSDGSPDARAGDGPLLDEHLADGPAPDATEVACGAARCGPRQACVIPCCLGACLSPGPEGCPTGSVSKYCYPFPSDASTCEMTCEPAAPRCVDIPAMCNASNLCACDALRSTMADCVTSSPQCLVEPAQPRTIRCACLRA